MVTSIPSKKKKFCCKSGCDDCPFGFSSDEVDPSIPVELLGKDKIELTDEQLAEELLEKYAEFDID
ncbi:hypothetical protein [Bacteriovorax sp. DB6_IX]|uniref:hypothetical protein n=1 Tax=Bacteriovorax sp. DB6_IX TaxID=1353530 RepID=UPI00038A47A6|nr:hypothetical protein [Bacteriovorax sp. DB6_IX]EQC51286.1 hypothetical protein M901_2416 [Bacteriovorax sp. DB6_IX]